MFRKDEEVKREGGERKERRGEREGRRDGGKEGRMESEGREGEEGEGGKEGEEGEEGGKEKGTHHKSLIGSVQRSPTMNNAAAKPKQTPYDRTGGKGVSENSCTVRNES